MCVTLAAPIAPDHHQLMLLRFRDQYKNMDSEEENNRTGVEKRLLVDKLVELSRPRVTNDEFRRDMSRQCYKQNVF